MDDYAWEWAVDKEAKKSVLLLREGGLFFIGFNVPSPDSPVFERSMLQPYFMPEGEKLNAYYAWKVLQEYVCPLA